MKDGEVPVGHRRVFVSHSARDLDGTVLPLKNELDALGVETCLNEFEAGDRIADRVADMLRTCSHFLLVATNESINLKHQHLGFQSMDSAWSKARWVSMESRLAADMNTHEGLCVIVLQFDGVELPGVLKGYICIQCSSKDHPKTVSRKLSVVLNRPVTRAMDPVMREHSETAVDLGREFERFAARYGREGNDRRPQDPGRDTAGQIDTLGVLHQAIRCYDMAIRLNPASYKAWANKGWCQWKLHQDDDAWRHVNVAQLIESESTVVRKVIKRMKEGKRTLR